MLVVLIVTLPVVLNEVRPDIAPPNVMTPEPFTVDVVKEFAPEIVLEKVMLPPPLELNVMGPVRETGLFKSIFHDPEVAILAPKLIVLPVNETLPFTLLIWLLIDS